MSFLSVAHELFANVCEVVTSCEAVFEMNQIHRANVTRFWKLSADDTM